jgi:hypothetical protein
VTHTLGIDNFGFRPDFIAIKHGEKKWMFTNALQFCGGFAFIFSCKLRLIEPNFKRFFKFVWMG